MTKTIEQTYQILDEISHIRLRTGMYAGSTSLETSQQWIYDVETKKMLQRELSVIPAFIKIFSEILDNAIDEARRAPDVLDSIRVEINEDGSMSVLDNGRGIPVEIHSGAGKYVAETVFSNLRSGSNFSDDEDQQLIGTNGLGSVLTNVLSTSFKIESCDGKKLFKQEFTKGMRERGEPKIKPHDKNHTKITFTPDYEFFQLKGMDEDHKLRIIKKVVDAAATNTGVKFYVNGERILTRNFDDYIAMYTDDFVYDSSADWKVGISKADSFEQISFVNSVETYQGGEHVKYAINQIVDELRAVIKKKNKIDVSPGDIRNHMRIYISCNVNRPKFSSQTKENLISLPSSWKTTWTVPDKFIQKLLKSSIIQSILDWVSAKEQAALMADLRKANKEQGKADPRKIDKFSDATERKDRQKCVLFLAEGDTLDENTEICVLENNKISNIAIKNVKTGDLVLTHKNRFRQVLSTSPKVIEGVKIIFDNEELIISPEHRLIAYDITTREFSEVKGKDLDKTKHKLIKNQLVNGDHAKFKINKINHEKYQFNVEINGLEESILSTESHKFLVFDLETLSYQMIEAQNLSSEKHSILLKQE